MVSFLVIGTQKGGTSALDEYLRENKDILMASKKELHFFDEETEFDTTPDYSKYHSYFEDSVAGKLLGESTPIYMYWKNAPKRIWDYNSKMKLIVMLRNPIERAYSHWNMEKTRNTEFLSFFDAINTEKYRCKDVLPLQHRIFSYIDRGQYSEQLGRIWSLFSREQVLVIKNTDLMYEPNITLSKIASFLGIRDFKNIEPKNVHSTPYSSKLTKEDYNYLKGIYFYEIKKLERILDWDCSDWLQY